MKAIGLTSTFSASELHADSVIEDLRHLRVDLRDGKLELHIVQ
jgi:hypothetical protein